jgi:hypothetical protein
MPISSPDSGEDWMLFVAADHLNLVDAAGLDPLFMARLTDDGRETQLATMSMFAGLGLEA